MLETICEVLEDAYKRNWITSRDGNVSIRHHDRDHFYITPSGVRKQTLQPDQFKKISIPIMCNHQNVFSNIITPLSLIPLKNGAIN
jgi:ribulose-5-phosphate 4-epimerase/fuculose-1-phosphate aldolase